MLRRGRSVLLNQWRRAVGYLLALGGEYPTRRYSAYSWLAGTDWVPSHSAKRRHLLRLFAERGHATFIEAGTYKGDTVELFVPRAARIISVELDADLHEHSARRFASVGHVDIRRGDATELIPAAAAECPPSLIFLDGHFSGPGTALGDQVEPAVEILERLGAVAPAGTTIVVDDLRLFGRADDYPDLDVLTRSARAGFPTARIRAGLDSLVIEA